MDLIRAKEKYITHEPVFNQCPLCYNPKTSENILMSLGVLPKDIRKFSDVLRHLPNMNQHIIIL